MPRNSFVGTTLFLVSLVLFGLSSVARADITVTNKAGSPTDGTSAVKNIDESNAGTTISLGFHVIAGTVGFFDLVNGQNGPVSDELVFKDDPNDNTKSVFTFYSDEEQTLPDKTFDVNVSENPAKNGTELTIYNAKDAAGNLVRYNVTSDSPLTDADPIPEPSTLVLFGLGLGAAAIIRRRVKS